jgi:hypothetical protein
MSNCKQCLHLNDRIDTTKDNIVLVKRSKTSVCSVYRKPMPDGCEKMFESLDGLKNTYRVVE